MPLKSIALLACSLLLFTSCNDPFQARVTIYDKNITKIPCLAYNPTINSPLHNALKKMYHFDKNCPFRLHLGYKNNIVCKSTFNVPSKVNSAFPRAYIRLDVQKGFKMIYTYYKDLKDEATYDDLKAAFERLKKDIL